MSLDILDYIDRAAAPNANIDALKTEVQDLQFNELIYKAAVAQNFHEPEAVVTLLKGKRSAGVSVEELVSDLGRSKPFLIKPAEKPVPSRPQYKVTDIFGPTANGTLANKLAKTDMNEYRRLRAEAVKQGILSR